MAIVINGRERKKDKRQAGSVRTSLRSTFFEKSGCVGLCVCECVSVCELFLNRDLSHTVINHRTTHKLRHLQPRKTISGLLTFSSDDEHRAPSNIFSFSDEIDQSSNPQEESFTARAGWLERQQQQQQQQTAPCHTARH